MITFHFEAAKAMISDLLADEGDWWDDELQTLTGFTRADYQTLAARLGTGFLPSTTERDLLHAAANSLLGYPGISTDHCENSLGKGWRETVQSFIERKPS